ncbi:molybdopterin dinucleotide binding domain-containing protein, partial [Escherichia coli]
TGFHDKGHVHSTYFNVAMLREAIPHQFWLNPVDAAQRGLKSGDIAEIYNERGRLHIRVKVTGFHDKGHVHSTYFNVAMLREAIPHQFWLNPV